MAQGLRNLEIDAVLCLNCSVSRAGVPLWDDRIDTNPNPIWVCLNRLRLTNTAAIAPLKAWHGEDKGAAKGRPICFRRTLKEPIRRPTMRTQ